MLDIYASTGLALLRRRRDGSQPPARRR